MPYSPVGLPPSLAINVSLILFCLTNGCKPSGLVRVSFDQSASVVRLLSGEQALPTLTVRIDKEKSPVSSSRKMITRLTRSSR